MIIGARGDDLSNRGVDRAVRTRVRIGAQCVGVAGPGHHAALLGLAARQHRQQRRHRLRGAALRLAAKGHEQRERTDGGVEALGKAAAGRALEAARHIAQRAQRASGLCLLFPSFSTNACVLDRAVRVEDRARKVGDRLSAPVHDHAGALSHDGHAVGLQVFGLRGSDEKLLTASFAEDIPFTRFDNGAAAEATVYALPDSDAEPLTYGLYMGGDIAETVIRTDRPELPNALIFGDSFTNPVECLAYYSFNELRSVDLRHYTVQSLSDYIAAYQPDVVLCVRDYQSLLLREFNGDFFS